MNIKPIKEYLQFQTSASFCFCFIFNVAKPESPGLGSVDALGLEKTLFLRLLIKDVPAKGYIPDASRFGKTGKREKRFCGEKQAPGGVRGPGANRQRTALYLAGSYC